MRDRSLMPIRRPLRHSAVPLPSNVLLDPSSPAGCPSSYSIRRESVRAAKDSRLQRTHSRLSGFQRRCEWFSGSNCSGDTADAAAVVELDMMRSLKLQ